MRAFWEKLGVLGPIYRLVGRGVSDADIANKLNLTEPNVQSYIAWTLHFLRLTDRNELVRHASLQRPLYVLKGLGLS
jgi:DNA-binding NarL/FixJ family response regulator